MEENKKKLIIFGISTYAFSIPVFILFNYILLIVIPDTEDWEIFSYSFFSSFAIYGLSGILFWLFALALNLKRLTNTFFIITLIAMLEVSTLLIFGESTIKLIIQFVLQKDPADEFNPYLFTLFGSVLISYFTCKVLKVKFLKKHL